jgi:hypothetical protein
LREIGIERLLRNFVVLGLEKHHQERRSATVSSSWYAKAKKFKSPTYVVAAFLLRSRQSQRELNERLREEIQQRTAECERQARQRHLQQQLIDDLMRRNAELEEQLDEARQAVNLPEDRPLATHGYGARMIALAVNLARSVGLRGAARVIKLFFEWLGLKHKTPSRTTIRDWFQRLGIARMSEPLGDHEDLVIMADHSNQIGAEKVLVMLGVKTSALPEPGQALQHQHIRVLEVKPGRQWKTEDMQREYEALADRYGTPRAVVVDGAVELREGAKCLKKRRPDMIVLGDFKHYAANVMKSLVGKDDRFQEVTSQIGKTRSAIQQTELAHLVPPSSRPKARFMNLAATIRWMTLIVWLLKNPNAAGRAGISDERMQEKLGWVADYADDIAVWQECQDVVSTSVTFINEQYLYQGASAALRTAIGDSLQHTKSQTIAKRLIDFVHDSEQHLRAGERLPMSTEILESSLGLYKQLEGQQSKSGFTSLLACFPALLQPTTPAEIQASFHRVFKSDVDKWTKERFGTTVTSRRQAAFAEHKTASKRATHQQATT